MVIVVESIRRDLRKESDPEKAPVLQRFFKTGPGQYGEGDVFLGVTVPQSRLIAKKYKDQVTLQDVKALLDSKIHEERLVALLLLVRKYKDDDKREHVAKFYLSNLNKINNWDLVDLTAPSILGAYLENGDRSLLYKMAESKSVWERRIAIVATLYFIRKGDFDDTLKIAEALLHDDHDLIHKAAGWMLREVGKKNMVVEEEFVARHCTAMPRTMLRYAIERFPEGKRARYLRKA
jgi:3-methyladenine DNA glycosylase AlkD